MLPRWLVGLLGAALGVALALWIWTLGTGSGPAEPAPGQQEESEPPGPPPPRAVEAPQAGEIEIASGGTIEIDSKALEAGTPVVVRLDLAVPSQTDEPRPIRLIGPGRFVRHGEGTLSEDRTSARYEIDPAWLAPGRYILEVKTTEPSHFPLRRYALEVR